ncbi:MAG: hypothetical protein MPJ22_00060 [Pirellulales bacterium]|nr:hypothetical protein [Pirellulales bacterium]MDA8040801.1 hypothetical protein [Pirellulales bacterium]
MADCWDCGHRLFWPSGDHTYCLKCWTIRDDRLESQGLDFVARRRWWRGWFQNVAGMAMLFGVPAGARGRRAAEPFWSLLSTSTLRKRSPIPGRFPGTRWAMRQLEKDLKDDPKWAGIGGSAGKTEGAAA